MKKEIFNKDTQRVFLHRKDQDFKWVSHTHFSLGLNENGYKSVSSLKAAITKSIRNKNLVGLEKAFSEEGLTQHRGFNGGFSIDWFFTGEKTNVQIVRMNHEELNDIQTDFRPDTESVVMLNDYLEE